jgi:cytochrome P450
MRRSIRIRTSLTSIVPSPKPILGFGYGQHRYQGEWLSRVELEAVFSTLHQELPNLRLAMPEKEIKYTPAEQACGDHGDVCYHVSVSFF